MATQKGDFELLEQKEETTYKPNEDGPTSRKKKILIAAIVVLVIVLVVIAFIVGYFVRQPASKCKAFHSPDRQDNSAFYESAVSGISAPLIEKHLR